MKQFQMPLWLQEFHGDSNYEVCGFYKPMFVLDNFLVSVTVLISCCCLDNEIALTQNDGRTAGVNELRAQIGHHCNAAIQFGDSPVVARGWLFQLMPSRRPKQQNERTTRKSVPFLPRFVT